MLLTLLLIFVGLSLLGGFVNACHDNRIRSYRPGPDYHRKPQPWSRGQWIFAGIVAAFFIVPNVLIIATR